MKSQSKLENRLHTLTTNSSSPIGYQEPLDAIWCKYKANSKGLEAGTSRDLTNYNSRLKDSDKTT